MAQNSKGYYEILNAKIIFFKSSGNPDDRSKPDFTQLIMSTRPKNETDLTATTQGYGLTTRVKLQCNLYVLTIVHALTTFQRAVALLCDGIAHIDRNEFAFFAFSVCFCILIW